MSSAFHAHASADAWDTHATTWSGSVQEITLAPCTTLLKQADALLSMSSTDTRVLDDGSGSGQLTGLIKAKYPALPVIATDISQGMLDALSQRSKASDWQSMQTVVQDAQNLDQLEDNSFSHVFCTFVINFTAEPQQAINEMHRVLRPGGVVAILTWSEVSWLPCWQAAVREASGDPSYTAPALFHTGTTDAQWMRTAAQKAGFKGLQVERVRCFHPKKSAASAVVEFYGMGNPSIKRLMDGFDDDLIEATKEPFRKAFDERWGSETQYEVAIMTLGRKAA